MRRGPMEKKRKGEGYSGRGSRDMKTKEESKIVKRIAGNWYHVIVK